MNPKPITVRILVTVPDEESLAACTLCFETLRVGFPTAKIQVTVNQSGLGYYFGGYMKIVQRIQRAERAEIISRTETWHHADWIQHCVEFHDSPGPLVILDPDTIFWKSCEDWEFPESTLLAGYLVPHMWNDFAKCVSVPRIHTSLMWFPDTWALGKVLAERYPYSHQASGEYCPCNPFRPTVQFIRGRPVFWDSCANLYGMLAYNGLLIQPFEDKHKECFDHLNSASFFDVMAARLDDNRGFVQAHREGVRDPMKLRNLWPIVDAYYREKSIEGLSKTPL